MIAALLVLWVTTARAEPPATAERAWRQARSAIERKDYPVADQLLAAALARFDGHRDRWYWELHVLRGLALFATGRDADAKAFLNPTLPADFAKSEPAVRRLLYLAILRSDPSLATQARTLAKQVPAVEPEAFAVSATLDKQPARGEAFARTALRLAEAHGDPYIRIWAMNEIVRRCTDQDRYTEAMLWSEKLLPAVRQRHLDAWTQKAEGNLGWIFLGLGDYERAAGLFESAQATAARLNLHPDFVRWTNQRGNVALQMGDYANAEKYCAAAVRIAGSDEVTRGHALANLARVAIETGRLDLAQRYNADSLSAKNATGDAPGVERSKVIEAEIASLRGHHDAAIALLDAIAKTTAKASVRWEAQGRLAQVLLRAKQESRAETEFEDAIRTIGKARSSIGDAELRLSFFRTAEDVFDAYVDFLVGRDREEEALAVTEKIRAATLEEELGLDARKKVDPKKLAAEHHATILCYWLGRAKSYVWAVTPNAIELRALDRDAVLGREIDDYQRSIVDPRSTQNERAESGRSLYRKLIAPVASWIPAQGRVIVVPDGRLHVLNLETLVVDGPRPRYWIEDVTLVEASSLQLLDRRPDASARTTTRAMLVVGDPLVEDAAYPPLANAQTEIANVRARFSDATVLDRKRATPAAYRAAAPGTFRYLHFVAHGEATRGKALDAAVILAKDATGAYKLAGKDIIGQRLGAELVTVSSCYGAGTRPFVGEGLVGLAWAFLSAGARQVIAALWEVSDTAAPYLMDDMYVRIRAGDDPATALRAAKLQMIRKDRAEPYYWAPFVLYGR